MTDTQALATPEPTSLAPLKVSCRKTDCVNGLHYFGKKRLRATDQAHGPCITCKQELIDWEQVHARDLTRAADTILQLQREWIRHHYWHRPLDQHAINRALRRGRIMLREKVRSHLSAKVGSAEPSFNGRQTSWGGPEPTTYAQHATASCCRKCIEEWHGISRTRALTSQELDYLTELAMLYLERRIDQLTDEPQHVPSLREARGAS